MLQLYGAEWGDDAQCLRCSQKHLEPKSVEERERGTRPAKESPRSISLRASRSIMELLRRLSSAADVGEASQDVEGQATSPGASTTAVNDGSMASSSADSFLQSFQKQLKRNASLRKEQRKDSLQKLSKITNSRAYREQLAEVVEGGDHQALRSLYALLDEHMTISIDELRYVRRLGEGAFGFVDMYERTLPGGGQMQYAVKVMKDKMMLPPATPYGEPQVVSVPATERIKFLAEAALMEALQHPNVVSCFGCVREPALRETGTRPPPKLLQEFCAGGTLLDQIRRPRCAQEWARSIPKLGWPHPLSPLLVPIISPLLAHSHLLPPFLHPSRACACFGSHRGVRRQCGAGAQVAARGGAGDGVPAFDWGDASRSQARERDAFRDACRQGRRLRTLQHVYG